MERVLRIFGWLGHTKNVPSKPPLPKGYLTTKQAAERLGLTDQAVRDLVRRDRLPARWNGQWLIKESDVATFKPKKRGGQRKEKK